MKRGDELALTLESSTQEGRGVARVDGLVVFVTGAVPGDQVRARVTKVKKQFLEAETTAIVSPSPLRTEPRCRYFGTCGGCAWQHVDYGAQLEFKRRHVRDVLERIGGFAGVEVPSALGAEDSYFYRNKMEFSFGEKWLTREEMEGRREGGETGASTGPGERTGDRFALGLHIPQRFDKVLDIEECFLQSERSAALVNLVRRFCVERNLSCYSTRTHTGYLRNLVIREGKRTGELMVNLVTSEDHPETMRAMADLLLGEFPSITTIVNNITQRKSLVAIGDEERVYHGPGFITESVGPNRYRISANSFFQTNTLQAERLYDTVRQMAELTREDIVFDLYSGTGTIALHIARSVREVVGIEAVDSAVDDAWKNARVNGVENCSFVLGDLKERLTKDTEWFARHRPPTVVIVDPPRSGMHERVVMQLRDLRPERLVYVSCNPSTQARDLKLLCANQAFRISGVQPVDMFPHTYHIENIVGIRRLG